MRGSTESMMKQSRKVNARKANSSKTSIASKGSGKVPSKRTSINNVYTDSPKTTYLCGSKNKPCVAHKTIGDRPFTAEDFSPSKRNSHGRSSWCKYCCRADYQRTKEKRLAEGKRVDGKTYGARPEIDIEEYSSAWQVGIVARFFKYCNTLRGDYTHEYTSL